MLTLIAFVADTLSCTSFKKIRLLRRIAKSVVISPSYCFACFFQIMLDHTKLYIGDVIICEITAAMV